MRILKKIFLGLLLVFILIQFIQPVRNTSNQVLPIDLTKTINVPGYVYGILKSACYDCHSNNTNYPWYSKIQPIGWVLANHIREGMGELNFSDFGSYSKRRQISKLNGISNSIKNTTMPLKSYRLVHKSARLSNRDKALLIKWAVKCKDSLVAGK